MSYGQIKSVLIFLFSLLQWQDTQPVNTSIYVQALTLLVYFTERRLQVCFGLHILLRSTCISAIFNCQSCSIVQKTKCCVQARQEPGQAEEVILIKSELHGWI